MAKVGVSLSAFVDFAVTGVMSKAGIVQKVKRQTGPTSFDYWMPLRNAIITLHRQDDAPATLMRVLDGLDERKVDNYQECLAGYRKWLGRKHPEPIPGRHRGAWTSGELTVRVSPELILQSGQQRYAIKLYFGRDPISLSRIRLFHYLMRKVLASTLRPAVLDVRRSRLHPGNPRTSREVDAALASEAALFLSYWGTE